MPAYSTELFMRHTIYFMHTKQEMPFESIVDVNSWWVDHKSQSEGTNSAAETVTERALSKIQSMLFARQQ
jgi:hypothetical protein